MNVYDFDNTIYRGESVFDFYLFSVRKNPRLIRFLPLVIRTLWRYKKCKITQEELDAIAKEYASEFVREVSDLPGWVKEFWDKNERKIKPWYLERKREDDVIVSASFDVILEEICPRIGIHRYLSSKIDPETGEVKELCFGAHKPRLWQEAFPGQTIDAFYTDSAIDSPMVGLSEHAYLVKKREIVKIK